MPQCGAHTSAPQGSRAAAKRNGIEIRNTTFYDMVDDVKKAMSGLLAPDACARNMLGKRLAPGSVQYFQGRQGRGCRVTDGHRGTRRRSA